MTKAFIPSMAPVVENDQQLPVNKNYTHSQETIEYNNL